MYSTEKAIEEMEAATNEFVKEEPDEEKTAGFPEEAEETGCVLAAAEFVTDPPSNLRKSNFFNFTVKLLDHTQQPLEIESATFVSFCDVGPERNGVRYLVRLVMPDQSVVEEDLFVRLVDNTTGRIVPFEGSQRTPDLARVLLTHRAICSRCSQDKTCGNSSDTPSDPVLLNSDQEPFNPLTKNDVKGFFMLKFYLKCNQNCHLGAGSPKSPRRFRLMLSTSLSLEDRLCWSGDIFVHNSSKHAKTSVQASKANLIRKKTELMYQDVIPLNNSVESDSDDDSLKAVKFKDIEADIYENGNPWHDPDEEIVLEFLKIFRGKSIKDKIVLIERVIKCCSTFENIKKLVGSINYLFDGHMKVNDMLDSCESTFVDPASCVKVEFDEVHADSSSNMDDNFPVDKYTSEYSNDDFLSDGFQNHYSQSTFALSNSFNDPELNQKIEMMTEKVDGVWFCLSCGKSTKNKSDLRRHIEFKHIDGITEHSMWDLRRKMECKRNELISRQGLKQLGETQAVSTFNQGEPKYTVSQDLMDLIKSTNPTRNIRFTYSQRLAVQMCVDNFLLKKKRGPYLSGSGVRTINWKCVKDGKTGCGYSCVTLEGRLSEHHGKPHNHKEDDCDLFAQKQARFQLRQKIALDDMEKNPTSVVEDVVMESQSEGVLGSMDALRQAARRYKRTMLKRREMQDETVEHVHYLEDMSSQETISTPFVDTGTSEVTECPKKRKRFTHISGYLVFSGQERRGTSEQNPGVSFGEISRLLSERWKGMTGQEKQYYEYEARKVNLERMKKDLENNENDSIASTFSREEGGDEGSGEVRVSKESGNAEAEIDHDAEEEVIPVMEYEINHDAEIVVDISDMAEDDAQDILLGKVFLDEEQVETTVKTYAKRKRIAFVRTSNNKRQMRYECKHGKFRPSQSDGVRPNQHTVKMGCKAKINLSKRNSGEIVVTTLVEEHNHPANDTDTVGVEEEEIMEETPLEGDGLLCDLCPAILSNQNAMDYHIQAHTMMEMKLESELVELVEDQE